MDYLRDAMYVSMPTPKRHLLPNRALERDGLEACRYPKGLLDVKFLLLVVIEKLPKCDAGLHRPPSLAKRVGTLFC